jgi:aspartyl-tRNA(Asn)/glutamyl-tRNA(Gln) amidotransferase subunit A
LIGTYVLSAGYYDAYYKKAQAVRTLIKKDFDEIFKQVDVLITPTSPFTAFNIGEKSSDPLSLYLADVMVSPAAVAGMPAISVPIGKTEKGLPVGIQIVGNRLKEEVAMRVAVEM